MAVAEGLGENEKDLLAARPLEVMAAVLPKRESSTSKGELQCPRHDGTASSGGGSAWREQRDETISNSNSNLRGEKLVGMRVGFGEDPDPIHHNNPLIGMESDGLSKPTLKHQAGPLSSLIPFVH